MDERAGIRGVRTLLTVWLGQLVSLVGSGVAGSVVKRRGWKSEATLNKAKQELLAKDFIMVPRQGGQTPRELVCGR